jgi:hypothetical protein
VKIDRGKHKGVNHARIVSRRDHGEGGISRKEAQESQENDFKFIQTGVCCLRYGMLAGGS